MLILDPPQSVLDELHQRWFPGSTDGAVAHLVHLLESASPLLVSGYFSKMPPQGCLATQIAWHHPNTAHLAQDSGIVWLDRVANLSPVTSTVLTFWDARGANDLAYRHFLLDEFRAERHRRQQGKPTLRAAFQGTTVC